MLVNSVKQFGSKSKCEKRLRASNTGFLVDGTFKIIVHDERLTIGANYSNLEIRNGEVFFEELILRCKDEKRKLLATPKQITSSSQMLTSLESGS